MDSVLQKFRRSFEPSTPFFQPLSLDPPMKLEELYKRDDRYSMLEDNVRVMTQTVRIRNQPTEGNQQLGKKSSEFKEGQSRDQKRSRD